MTRRKGGAFITIILLRYIGFGITLGYHKLRIELMFITIEFSFYKNLDCFFKYYNFLFNK